MVTARRQHVKSLNGLFYDDSWEYLYCFSQIIIPNWEFIKNQKASSFLWDTSDPAVIFDFPKVFYIHSNPSVKGT